MVVDAATARVIGVNISLDEEPDVSDAMLGDAMRLLDMLTEPPVPMALGIEAALYAYVLSHDQAAFAGRIDRVVALDGGRVARLLLAACEWAYPGGDFGGDEWAHTCVFPLAFAAERFLVCVREIGLLAATDVTRLSVCGHVLEVSTEEELRPARAESQLPGTAVAFAMILADAALRALWAALPVDAAVGLTAGDLLRVVQRSVACGWHKDKLDDRVDVAPGSVCVTFEGVPVELARRAEAALRADPAAREALMKFLEVEQVPLCAREYDCTIV